MHVTLRSVLASAAILAAAGLAAVDARAAATVNLVVLKEHAVGSTSTAQPYLDKLIGLTATQNGWDPGSKGKFFTKRADADAWIKSDGPHYGILSVAPFLELRQQYNLEVIGQAIVAGVGGGQQYFIVSKTASDLAGCKAKKLATDHADDVRFIEKVVAAGAWKLADFTVDKTTRHAQAGSKVANAEADCALIDDAQLQGVTKVDPAIKPVWSSAKLPPMVIVAFPSAPAAEKTAFQSSLPKICQGAGQQTCNDVGLTALKPAAPAEYAAVIAAY